MKRVNPLPGPVFMVTVLAIGLFTLLVIAHDDDQFEQDRIPPYDGPGYKSAVGGAPPIEFPASGVTLLSWIPLTEFAPEIFRADDCWGYVSPSGREYAIIGLSHGTAFVEVTNPGNPQLVGSVMTGPTSTWRDIKTYLTYAYAVSEAGSGIQVFDLSQIDSGIITLANTVTDTGSSLLTTAASHNVAINETSGYLYRIGGSGSAPAGTLAGLRIYDLVDPANPVYVGDWTSRYIHDAQVVTWTTGPHAGKEIAFCFSNTASGGGSPGVDILDVTDKSNILSLSLATYDSPAYSHQGWLSPDQQYLYLNDELDEITFGTTTTTRIIDVSDPANPLQVGSFTNGNTSIDHNLYTLGNRIYESNYRSGLRIYDATDPVNPFEIAYFDTWPADDNANFNGLWNNYPYLPSGIVVGSDLEKGLFVWWPGDPLLDISFPSGLPTQIGSEGEALQVQILTQSGGVLAPGSPMLHYSIGEVDGSSALVSLGGDLYEAQLPAATCGAKVNYFIAAETDNGVTWRNPSEAPSMTHVVFVTTSNSIANYRDNFETDTGWTVTDNGTLLDGNWDRGVPVGGGDRGDPATDGDGSGQCYLTDNVDGDSDVDGGWTILTSPVLDSTGNGTPFVEYYRWFTTDAGVGDSLMVELSTDNGDTWVVLESVVDSSPQWVFKSFRINEMLSPSIRTRVRFTATDIGIDSLVEAGIDRVQIVRRTCTSPGDANEDGTVNVTDLLSLLAGWGICGAPCSADFNADGIVNVSDLLILLANWG